MATSRPKTSGKAKPSNPVSDKELMEDFYKKRSKDPLHYIYTPEGNLLSKGIKKKDGTIVPDRTIPLRPFSSLLPEEREQLEQDRLEALADIEADYEQSLIELRLAVKRFHESGRLPQDARAVVNANQKVQKNDLERSKIAYPMKWIKVLENPSVNEILLNQRYETRKMGYDVYLFKRQDLEPQYFWGQYRKRGEDGKAMAGGGENIEILFITDVNNEKTGHFHPAFEKEFVFAETQYVSPYQAFEAERFRELENESIRKQILGTRSARTIKNLVEKEDKQVEKPDELWEDILDAFYSQHKDMAEKLKSTGSAKFHLMDKEIGSQDFIDALENIRTRLREESDDAEKAPQVAKESVITEEEQKKAKKAAIINTFKRRGGF